MKSELISNQVEVGTADRRASFDKVSREIESFGRLPLNWDTYGGKPAEERVRTFCQSLLEDLRDHSVMGPPLVRPISTGMYLEWRNNGDRLYFEVDEDSVFVVQMEGGKVVQRSEDAAFRVDAATKLLRDFYR